MNDIWTGAQVAKMLGLDASTVRRNAKARGIGRKLGHDWLFDAADVEQLRRLPSGGKVGRPKAKRSQ